MDYKVFGLGAVVGIASSVIGFWALRQWNRKEEAVVEKKEKKQKIEGKQYDQLKQEQLARVIKFFGEQKFQKLQSSFVIVFGVGGVGSHVVNMLARSGVKRIRVVDFDRVSLSSLNRHSFAVREDVGTPKVECIKKYVNKIFPHICIETVETYVTVQNAKELVQDDADYIIDCIDNLDAKVQLISMCVEKKLRLLVSGGAGMKNDPTKLQIRDIADCKYDNLILRIKRELTKKGIKKGVKVAYSYQQSQKQLLPLTEVQEDNPHAYKVFDNYRIRIVPVLGTMPAIIGMSIASYVLCQLAGEPYEPFQTDYVKSTMINRVYNQLLFDQRKRGVEMKDMLVDMEEVSILCKVVYKWNCLISGKKQSNPRLIRWDPELPATIDNLALLSKEHYEKHKHLKKIQGQYSGKILEQFEKKSKKAKQLYDSGYMMFI